MISKSPMPLGVKIKLIREARGYSQEQMARLLKIKQSKISDLETGKAEYDDEILQASKKILEIENAPLLPHEIDLYKDRIWVWNDMITANRIIEAVALRDELSCVMPLHYEHDLILLYLMTDVRLLIKERKSERTDEIVGEIMIKAQAYLEGASNDALHLYHRNNGFLNVKFGNSKEGLAHYLKSIDIAGDNMKPDSAIYAVIGLAYSSLGKPYHAIRHLETAIRENRSDRVDPNSAHTMTMLAQNYILTKEYNSAKKLIDICVPHARRTDHKLILSNALLVQGYLYHQLGQYREAIAIYDQHLKMPTNGLSISSIANKAQCFFALKELAKAHEVIEQGRVLLQELRGQENHIRGGGFGLKLLSLRLDAVQHLMSLNNKESLSYLENVAIPRLAVSDGYDKFFALDLCNGLRQHYTKKRAITKANAVAAVANDIMAEMFFEDAEV